MIEDVLQEPYTSSTVLPSLSVDFVSVAYNYTLPKGLAQIYLGESIKNSEYQGAMHLHLHGYPPEQLKVHPKRFSSCNPMFK